MVGYVISPSTDSGKENNNRRVQQEDVENNVNCQVTLVWTWLRRTNFRRSMSLECFVRWFDRKKRQCFRPINNKLELVTAVRLHDYNDDRDES